MAFPTKKPMGGAPAAGGMTDNPMDELMGPPHGEPDGDESTMNDLASKDIFGAEEDDAGLLGGGSPIETALMDAGINVSPEQLTQIEAILKPKPMAGKIGMSKPPMGGAKPMGAPLPPSPKATGGLTPGGMKPSMLG